MMVLEIAVDGRELQRLGSLQAHGPRHTNPSFVNRETPERA